VLRRRNSGWVMRQRRREATASDSKLHRSRGLPFLRADKARLIYPAPLHVCRVVFLLLRQRRGAAGNGLGTTAKYLRRTTSATASNGLGATIKYLRRTTSGAAGNGLGTTIKYLRGAAGIGRHDQAPATHNETTALAPRSSTCDAQQAAPRAAAWAPRSSPCDAQQAAPRATA
jgi:hypothetical protein